MNTWSGGHENPCSLCNIINTFCYKPERGTAQIIKLMRWVDNDGDWNCGRQLSNSSCSGLLARAIPPDGIILNASSLLSPSRQWQMKKRLCLFSSLICRTKSKSNKRKAVERLGSSQALEQFHPSYKTTPHTELCIKRETAQTCVAVITGPNLFSS